MTASDTALNSAMQHLDVESTASSSGYHTPNPAETISEETVSILEEAAQKLKKPRKKASKKELEPSSSTTSTKKGGRKRRRNESAPENVKAREDYPEASKTVYLKAKQLYIRKLHLATNVQHIKNQLSEGKFPPQVGFKCPPPSRDSAQFSLD